MAREPKLYQRADSPYWWVSFYDARGRRKFRSTEQMDPEGARRVLASLQRALAGRGVPAAKPGQETLKQRSERWLAVREEIGLANAKNDRAYFVHHIWPALGELPFNAVTRDQVKVLVAQLKRKPSRKGGTLAPRTVLHVYSLLGTLYRDAQQDEPLLVNPCTLRADRRELPTLVDKDPDWRDQAVYTHEEVAALVADERVPEDRRTFYAVMFAAGLRFGEVSELRWRDYDASTAPLGRLRIARAFSSTTKEVKGTKSEKPRAMPVHPVLAAMLATWKLAGWARMMGRPPKAEDLIIPSREGRNRRARHGLRRLHQDLVRLGFRRRGQHDARATFISLAVEDGADETMLERLTHGGGKKRGAFQGYVRLHWPKFCGEVARLNLAGAVTRLLRMESGHEKARESEDLRAISKRGVRDLNPWPPA